MTDKDKEKKNKPRSRKKGMTVKAKKKTAVARAVIKRGKGIVRINKRELRLVEPHYINELISEPLKIVEELSHEVDINVNATGGGFMGQAIASRAAIAKALCEYSNNEKIKKKLMQYDRTLLVDDPRRVETKKPLGKKARKKKQKSKR